MSGSLPDPALARAYQAAFHGHPAHALRLLRGRSRTLPRAAWLAGVALGAIGRYDEAQAALRPALSTTGHPDGDYRALAAAAYASFERQQGRYDSAADFDQIALATASQGQGARIDARLDALVGLTADAVGRADLSTARANLANLDAALATNPPPPVPSTPAPPDPLSAWRAPIRRGWVACEVALLAEDPAAAVAAAYPAAVLSARCLAPRHLAKSLLFLGVAVRESLLRRIMITKEFGRYDDLGRAACVGQAAEALAVGLIRRAESEAMSIGATPLATVARSLAAPAASATATAASDVACATTGKTPS